MGGGKSSGGSTTTVQPSPEQAASLKAQTDFLTKTAFPAYQKTVEGANNVYNNVNPAVTNASNTAMDVARQTGALQQGVGSSALTTGVGGTSSMSDYQKAIGNALTGAGANGLSGLGSGQYSNGAAMQQGGASGLASLFSPDYERNQVQGALQAGRESARESQAGQNAMYGGAGGLGSSRQVLADANLSSLNSQRQATAAANAQAGVENNRALAANSLLTGGNSAIGQANNAYSNLLSGGQSANSGAQSGYSNLAGQGTTSLNNANANAQSRISSASSPQDLYNKYASVIFGIPQGSTTPNFSGTQGFTTSGSSKGFGGQLKA